VDSFADVDLDYLTSIHELETSSSHDMLSFPGKAPAPITTDGSRAHKYTLSMARLIGCLLLPLM